MLPQLACLSSLKASSLDTQLFNWSLGTFVVIDNVALLLCFVQIRAVVDETFSFGQVPQAFDKLEKGHARGKTVIDVGKARSDS